VIREVHAASYGSYGANRVHAKLVLGRGIRVGHNAVTMLMRRAGIQGRALAPADGEEQGSRPRRNSSTASSNVTRPNELWLTTSPSTPTREGMVYCAVLLDAFSRRVVGWSISHNPTAALTTNALGMVFEQRDASRGTGNPFRPRHPARVQAVVATLPALRRGS
jgi:transposase InsO family protein